MIFGGGSSTVSRAGIMAVSIADVTEDARGRAAFTALAADVYRQDPHYCAPLRANDDLRGARAFVAWRGDRPVARAAAWLSRLDPTSAAPCGALGSFEAHEDPDAAGAVLRAAIDWLRARGAARIVGPMDGDTWHRYRLSVGPYDEPPFLMEPHNPPYYPALWEAAGFRPLERYFSKTVETLPAVLEALRPKAERAAAAYPLRALDPARFEAELEVLFELSRACFAGNFLYTDIGREQFLDLYSGTRPVIDPDLVCFASTSSGEPAGFLFAIPDRHRAVAAMRGRRGLAARLRYWLRRHADTVNMKTIGVRPEHRRAGLAAALCHRVYAAAVRKGYRRANLCLIRDGNPSAVLDADLGRVSRRYVLYELSA
jgi:GNAT superfamily N-acetyltransferase